MEDINVQLLNMDTKIPEHLVKNEDDSYTIFLNAKLTHENQLKSYYHAHFLCKNHLFLCALVHGNKI